MAKNKKRATLTGGDFEHLRTYHGRHFLKEHERRALRVKGILSEGMLFTEEFEAIKKAFGTPDVFAKWCEEEAQKEKERIAGLRSEKRKQNGDDAYRIPTFKPYGDPEPSFKIGKDGKAKQ